MAAGAASKGAAAKAASKGSVAPTLAQCRERAVSAVYDTLGALPRDAAKESVASLEKLVAMLDRLRDPAAADSDAPATGVIVMPARRASGDGDG